VSTTTTYHGRRGVVVTKHAKLALIAPPMAKLLGLALEAVAIDTDRLGTFSGEVPRPGPPLQTAVAKARLGMAASGSDLGFASEGTIGPLPEVPLCNLDRELVVVVDDREGIVVAGHAQSLEICAVTAELSSIEEATDLLARADLPAHRLIVQPAGGGPPIRKGIASREALRRAVAECAEADQHGLARVSTDLRANLCPSRRPTIAEAARRLAARLHVPCPACDAPGWGAVELEHGLPCERCGTATADIKAEVLGCARCAHHQRRPVMRSAADPSRCPWCNP